METNKPASQILKILLKEFTASHTITSLSKEIGMSRVGIWKTLKKMQSEKLVVLSPVGRERTNAYSIGLNWDNPLVEKTLALVLTEDALKNQRWINNFAELEKEVDFLIIYGSIIYSPKKAGDIDLLGIVSNKTKFLKIEEVIKRIQKTQIKKIHALNFTQKEFRQELEKQNKALIDAVKKGIILLGQEKFIKFMENMHKK